MRNPLAAPRLAALLAAMPLLALPARAANNPEGTEVPCRPVEDAPVCVDVVWPGATGVVARVSCDTVAFELLGLTNGVCRVEHVTRYVSTDPAKTDCPPPETSIVDEPVVPTVTWVLTHADESEEGSGILAAPTGAVHGAVSCAFTVGAESPCGEIYVTGFDAAATIPSLSLAIPPLVGVNDLVEPCFDPAAPVSLAEHLSSDADDLYAVSYSAADALLVEIFGDEHARVVADDGSGGVTNRFVSPPMGGMPKLEGLRRSDLPGDAEVTLRAEFDGGLVCEATASATVVGVEFDRFCYNRMDPYPQVEITGVEGLEPGGEATVSWRVLPDVADPGGLETNATFAVSSEPGSHEWAGAVYTNRFGNAGRAALRYTVSFDAQGNAVVTNGIAQPDRRAIVAPPDAGVATIQMGDALADAPTNALAHLSATPEVHIPVPEGERPDYFLRDIRIFAKEPSEWLTNEMHLASLGATALRADLLGVAHDTAAAIELAGPALVPVARDPSAPVAPGDDTARLRVDGLPGCIVKGAYTWTVEEGGVSLAFDTTEGISAVPAYTGSFDLSGGGSLADAILLPRVVGTAASDRAEDARISFTLVPDAGEDSGNPAAFRGQTLAAEYRLTVFDTRWTVCRPDGEPGRSAARDDLLECDLDLRPAVSLDAFEPRLGEPLSLTGTVRSYCDVVRDIRVNGHPVPAGDIQFLGHPVSEFASTNDLETVAWGMEPPYDVAFNIALDSFSGSAVVVEAYGTVSGHPGRLRVPVVFPAGATNGVAGVCGESSASPAWSTRSFYEFYRQDPGWDFLYKFEVDHAGAGAAILDVADGLRCVAQGTDSALYRLERPLVFLPPPVESTATAPGAASLRGPGLLFLDPADAPVTGTYTPEEAAGPVPAPAPLRTRGMRNAAQPPTPSGDAATASSDTLFPVSLGVSESGSVVPNADERWRGASTPNGNTVTLTIGNPFNMGGLPDDAVLTLSKPSDPGDSFPSFQPVSWEAGNIPEYWTIHPLRPGVAVFELSLDGTDVHSKDRVRISVVGIDLDIDSDNDGGIDSGNAFEEDDMEDTPGLPGKALFINELDTDKDGVPDFADGYASGAGPAAKSEQGSSRPFTPLRLRLGSQTPDDTIRLVCGNAAALASVSRTGDGTHASPYAYDVLSGKIRIWTKDGTDSRSAAPFPTGDLIQPGMAYSVAELIPNGERIFYVEAIRGSDTVGDVRITAHLESEGLAEPLEDSVRATVFHIEAVHPIAEDFGSNAGKIMISTRHDNDETPDRYYTTAITTAAGTPAQTSDRTVTVSAYVLPVPPIRIGTLQVFFEVTDPDDRSHYEGKIGADGKPAPDGTTDQGDRNPNDNRDPARCMTWNNGSPGGYDEFQQSCLSDRSAIPDLETIDGVQRYIAETTLTITDRHSGDNYCVRATLQNPGDQPFDTVSGMTGNAPIVTSSVKTTRNLVAWKRVYIEMDRMYKKGATILSSPIQVNGANGPLTQFLVDSGNDFAIGQNIVVFWKGGNIASTIVGVSGNIVSLSLIAVEVPTYSGIRILGEDDAYLSVSLSRVFDAYGMDPDGEDGGAFIEFRNKPEWGEASPKFNSFSQGPQLGLYSNYWFDHSNHTDRNNIAYLLVGAHFAPSVQNGKIYNTTGMSEFTSSVCSVYCEEARTPSELEDSVAHELGHRLGLNRETGGMFDHSDSRTLCPIEHTGRDKCIMCYGSNPLDDVSEFCLDCLLFGSGKINDSSLRDREDD